MMYTEYIMKRTQIYLDVEQDRKLAQRAVACGTTKSDLIRQAVTMLLDEGGREARRLERFRAALRAVAAGPLIDLPPGEDYVETVRAADAARLEELGL